MKRITQKIYNVKAFNINPASIEIVERGVDIVIKININGIEFYSRQTFETEQESISTLAKHNFFEQELEDAFFGVQIDN